jgi:hypothetical protein
VSLSNELCRSYLDLKWHFDPAAGAMAGAASAAGRLGHFDPASLREHLAAFRAIEAGIEELDVDDTADELDRTALLDDVRVTIFRIQHERPHERNPAFWLRHLCDALWSLTRDGHARSPDVTACLADVPRFLTDAGTTLRQPPAAFIDAARALTGPAAALMGELASEDADPDRADRAASAEAALARFQLTLDTELSAHADEHAFAAGAEQFDRLLHHEHAIMAGAPELWRSILRLEEEQEGLLRALAHEAGARDWRDALARRQSEIAPADVRAVLASRSGALAEAAERAGLPQASSQPDFERMPEHLARFEPLASYRPPIQNLAGVIYIAERPAVRLALPALLVELAGPGMMLQSARAAESPSLVRRTISENTGWGLYVIELLDQAKAWPDPGARLVVQAHVLYRILLARLDIALHTRQIGVTEAVETLASRLPLEPADALAAVRGILAEPTRGCGVIAGRRELLRLHADRAGREGAGFTARRHHDEVLEYGGLPVPLIRWGLGLEA